MEIIILPVECGDSPTWESLHCYSRWSAFDELGGFIQCLPSPNSVRRNQVFICWRPKKGDKCAAIAFTVWVVGGSGPVPSLRTKETEDIIYAIHFTGI